MNGKSKAKIVFEDGYELGLQQGLDDESRFYFNKEYIMLNETAEDGHEYRYHLNPAKILFVVQRVEEKGE